MFLRKKIIFLILLYLSIFNLQAQEFNPIKFPSSDYTYGQSASTQLLLKVKFDFTKPQLNELLKKYRLSLVDYFKDGDFYKVQLSIASSKDSIIQKLSLEDGVLYIEPDYLVHISSFSDDPLSSHQWHLNTLFKSSTADSQKLKSLLGHGSTIALLDCGIAMSNFDYNQDGILDYIKLSDIPQNQILDGFNFIQPNKLPLDDNGHGSFCASMIFSMTNNNEGGAGVAPKTKILPIKVLNEKGAGLHSDIAQGVYFAINKGARCLLMAFSGPPSNTLRQAIEYARHNGAVVICPAGNDGPHGNPSYPAAYDNLALAVGAVKYNQKIAPYSTKGAYVDLCAPGGLLSEDLNLDSLPDGILQQTFYNSPLKVGYYLAEGTSLAASNVAGVVSIIKGYGIDDPSKIQAMLQNSCIDLGTEGKDSLYGHGLIQPTHLLTTLNNPRHDLKVTTQVATPPKWCTPGCEVSLEVTIVNEGNFVENCNLILLNKTSNVQIASIPVSLPQRASTTESVVWNTKDIKPGNYIIEAKVDIANDDDEIDNNLFIPYIIRKDEHNIQLRAAYIKTKTNKQELFVTLYNIGTFTEQTLTLEIQDQPCNSISKTIALSLGPDESMSFALPIEPASKCQASGAFMVKVLLDAIDSKEQDISDNELPVFLSNP